MAIIAAFLVLIVSFAISLWSAWSARRPRVDAFLYGGNTELLGVSSCVGSVVSMAVSFTALLSAGFVWGWQILFSIVPGCVTGLLLLLYLSRHPAIAAHQPAVESGQLPDGASYIALFAARKPRLFGFYVFFLLAYTVMLITELTVLRTFLAALTTLPAPELVLIVAVIAFVCFAYVFIGGFRGVLVTDYFQLLVVIAFVGVWFAALLRFSSWSIPGPAASRLEWTALRLILLHVGCFAGAAAWMFASLDQWYRTFGTLPLLTARRVAITSAIALSSFVVVPVLAGSSAIAARDVPSFITNGISLFLVQRMVRSAPAGIRFLFVMALVCAALTTLNTYIITIQQAYYEFSIRLKANGFWAYVFMEFLAKWRNVRAVSLVLLIVAFGGSALLPERYVYAFGVASLATMIFAVPLLLNEFSVIRTGRESAANGKWARRAHIYLWVACAVFAALLLLSRSCLGSITNHLYVIPAAAAVASLTVWLVTAAWPQRKAEESLV